MKQQASLRPQRTAAAAIIMLGTLSLGAAAWYGIDAGTESAAAYTRLVEESYGLTVTGLNQDDPKQGLTVESSGDTLACSLLPVEQIRTAQPLTCRTLETIQLPAR